MSEKNVMKKKNTLKTLKAQIKQLNADADEYRDLYYKQKTETGELKEKLKEIQRKEMMEIRDNLGIARNEAERLTEIIRWLINPTTAEKKLTKQEEALLRRGY